VTGQLERDSARRGTVWTPEHAAEHVRAAYGREVTAVIATGLALREAKERLPHGKWAEAVALMPFGSRTAQKYMQAAELNASHATHLPASVEMLATLARLPDETLAKAVEAGMVTPEMARHEAQEVVTGLLEGGKTGHESRQSQGPAQPSLTDRELNRASRPGPVSRPPQPAVPADHTPNARNQAEDSTPSAAGKPQQQASAPVQEPVKASTAEPQCPGCKARDGKIARQAQTISDMADEIDRLSAALEAAGQVGSASEPRRGVQAADSAHAAGQDALERDAAGEVIPDYGVAEFDELFGLGQDPGPDYEGSQVPVRGRRRG
jgi:hypothetical protein